MTDLSERLGKLAGPDREIDVAIANALTPRGDSMLFGQSLLIGAWGPTGDLADRTHYFAEAPAYTASLDASVALVEKMLPGWSCGGDFGRQTKMAFVDPHDYSDRFLGARYTATGPTRAIALLIALFRALDAGGGG